MAKRLINQGRYGRTAIAGDGFDSIGSNGLATCVGIAIDNGDGTWWIAHVDCDVGVPSKTSAQYALVRDSTTDKMREYFGEHAGRATTMISASPDFSTQAIKAGIQAWCGGAATDCQWDGFEVTAAGVIQLLSHDANNWDGDGAFTVP